MVLGGIILDRRSEPYFADAFSQYRDDAKMHSEMKWNKVSRGKLDEYKAFVDLFFANQNRCHFNALVVDTSQIQKRRGDADLGFYKMMYQFLLHSFGSYLASTDRCTITLDNRNVQSYKLSTLHAILNNGLRKKYDFPHYPVTEIKVGDSKEIGLIQLADVLMGAIGYQVNGDDRKPEASEAKRELMGYIVREANLLDFRRSTSRFQKAFSIWHFRFNR